MSHKVLRSCQLLTRIVNRPIRANNYSTKSIVPESDIQKTVFISQSTDIFTNLALEDWLYKNFDFTNRHLLMIWRNEPCVVIGRHQNAWQEANISYLTNQGIPLARRNSGGGTVYHDKGNVNLTFFTSKEQYNRKYNLEIITRALFREYNINAHVNERDDIVVKDKYKISGTAAKLGRPSAYHHCTLLVNSDKAHLREALAKHESGIETKATQSVRSPICNLLDENPRITVDGLQTAIGWEYLRTPALHIEDGGLELIAKQKGFQIVNPIDYWFPGVEKIREDICSWEWRFGKTPDFKVSRSFTVPLKLLTSDNSMDLFVHKDQENQKLRIDMSVEKGIILDVMINVPPGLMASGFHGDASVVTHLIGKRFTAESLASLQEALQTHLGIDSEHKLGEKEQFVANCFGQVVNTN